MSLVYRILYGIGLKPWEEIARLPISAQLASLLDREQAGRGPPLGAALDVGCGSGIWSVDLAKRGWQVTGVDIVPRAVKAAQARVREAGVDARIVEGDMTALSAAGIGDGFRFVLDIGALHGLDREQRNAAAREITRVTRGDATMLLLAWQPGRRGPLPRGITRDDVRESFSQWEIIDDQPADVTGAPGFVRKAAPRWYRLRRG